MSTDRLKFWKFADSPGTIVNKYGIPKVHVIHDSSGIREENLLLKRYRDLVFKHEMHKAAPSPSNHHEDDSLITMYMLCVGIIVTY
jgi:hypothetical protein